MEYSKTNNTAQYAVDAIEAFLTTVDAGEEDSVIMSQIDRCDGDYREEFSIEYTVKADERYFKPRYTFESSEEAFNAYEEHVELIEEEFEQASTHLMEPAEVAEAGKSGGNILAP